MSGIPDSPYERQPPTGRRLAIAIGSALVAAVLILVLFVLPAEYGIDPTGVGRATGLTAINGPVRTLQVKDVVGGNEKYREIVLPDPGDPTPLPNPAVSQIKPAAPETRTVTVNLGFDEKTEIKALLDEAQVIVYSWKVEGGEVYTDFHGHEPTAGKAFVRYEEQQSGSSGHGSLVAPFSGEHGWYWLNVSDGPVKITLTVTGYFNGIKDYGLLR
ncbi:MAG: hypothetical protein ABW136_02915 [Steroidobacteraceae bacterium]